MRKLLLVPLAALLLLSIVLVGCQEGGIAQETYDKLKAQYEELADQYQDAADAVDDVKDQAESVVDDLQEVIEQKDELQAQVDELIDKYVLQGDTAAGTAQKIVEYYHETHVYDAYDMFVCADMAAEVWNMLKAQGISAVIVVGNLDRPIMEITGSNHSWVLAEVAPGEYLALETTAGTVVPREKNGMYYRGWTYATPSLAKEHQRLIREYNTRVEIVNDMNSEINGVVAEYNAEVAVYNQMIGGGYTQAQMDAQNALIEQLKAVKDKLVEVKESMEEELYNIQDELASIATPML